MNHEVFFPIPEIGTSFLFQHTRYLFRGIPSQYLLTLYIGHSRAKSCCILVVVARKKISTTVYLTAEQVRALKDLHERSRVPIAEYIRMGIDLVLEKHSEQLPGQMPLFDLNSMGARPKNQGESE